MEAADGLVLGTLALMLMVWSLVERRARRWGITGPMAFISAGMLLAQTVGEGLTPSMVLFLAEITLVFVLFRDASTVRLADLRKDPWIALRLLLVGFPLAMLLTFGLTAWLLPTIGLAGAVLVAASLTATDAGLGAPTIMDPAVPIRVRRALNVESGLNDGLATPVALAAVDLLVRADAKESDPAIGSFAGLDLPSAAGGLGLGVLIGAAFAVGVDLSRRAGWSSPTARALSVLALPVLVFGAAEMLHANVFLAAFACGLTFGRASRTVTDDPEVFETSEVVAGVLGSVLWFLAGGLFVWTLQRGFSVRWLIIALAALTVLRVVPVAVALVGCRFRWPTVLFLGWSGPRGIATIVFGLITFEQLSPDPRMNEISGVLSLTVLTSVFAHGITARPLAARYGSWVARTHAPVASGSSVEPLPPRGSPQATSVD